MKRIFSLLSAVAVSIFAAAISGMLTGCCSCRTSVVIPCETPYWQVVLTDYEGCWIAEYIAAGSVTKTCNGVCFQAVQRRIFKPVTLTFKYPFGRPVKVQGSNIIITPACKPIWLVP